MARPFAEGIGEAVARRSILRKLRKSDGKYCTKEDIMNGVPYTWETWEQVAERVAAGNISLGTDEELNLRRYIEDGIILMSGRHLQHGDMEQSERPMEVFTNCATASTSFMLYYLLLNGSGVGRCYDDDLMIIDWSKMPYIHTVLSEQHPDYDHKVHESLEQALHKYGKYITTFTVTDSREGWARAFEYLENLVYEGGAEHQNILFDFSSVRPKGALIAGMQFRPSSGPVPTMNAFNAIASLKGCIRPLWWQTMYVDHYLAESVLVGGARRSARIAIKYWRDPDILDFIDMKKGWRGVVPLWSCNNSIGVDQEFWDDVKKPATWAKKVFETACYAAYYHGTGEPGFLNLHKLSKKPNLYTTFKKIGSKAYVIRFGGQLLNKMERITVTKRHNMIVNPCGEVPLNILAGFCVIGDLALYHCVELEDSTDVARALVRALIRINSMDSVYNEEVAATNRIGVSLTGIHEFAWKFFGYSFKDLINERYSQPFWNFLSILSEVVYQESIAYSKKCGLKIPHTCTTIKPAGTTSKLFGLTEGAHLPTMREYIRWVQFRADNPLVKTYKDLGYKVKALQTYKDTVIVGFPTQLEACKINMPIVTANEATVSEHFTWLRLLERYWLRDETGGQISYTLKYRKSEVDFNEYKRLILHNIPMIKCCSVLPEVEVMRYEYLPEEAISHVEYIAYVSTLKVKIDEDLDKVHIDCAGGACPVDFNKEGS